MENLDLGWEFGVIVILFYGIVYYLIATVNYLLTVLLGGQIQKLTDKTISKDKKNIFYTALPFLISATIIFLTIIIPIDRANVLYNIPFLSLTPLSRICNP